MYLEKSDWRNLPTQETRPRKFPRATNNKPHPSSKIADGFVSDGRCGSRCGCRRTAAWRRASRARQPQYHSIAAWPNDSPKPPTSSNVGAASPIDQRPRNIAIGKQRHSDDCSSLPPDDDPSFVVLTETKFSFRCIPVWDRYSPHRTRVEKKTHVIMLSP